MASSQNNQIQRRAFNVIETYVLKKKLTLDYAITNQLTPTNGFRARTSPRQQYQYFWSSIIKYKKFCEFRITQRARDTMEHEKINPPVNDSYVSFFLFIYLFIYCVCTLIVK